jgi:DNA-binding XRE family transcriptional regulator
VSAISGQNGKSTAMPPTRGKAGRSPSARARNGNGALSHDALHVLADNMRAERHKRGMSQEALAHASGVHSSEISRIERGAREPRLSTLVSLARAFRITPSELLERVR